MVRECSICHQRKAATDFGPRERRCKACRAEYRRWRYANRRSTGALCANPNCNQIGTDLDHDHETGRVRGILCNACNATLGRVGDSPAILAGLIVYLHATGTAKAAPSLPKRPPPPAPCGTTAAFQRHQMQGEDPCSACAAAMRAYQQSYYRTRRKL